MKGAEANDKSIFRFLFFELWLIIIYNLRLPHRDFQVLPTKKIRSKVVKFTEKVLNELKRMKNQFFDFYFLSYGRFCTLNSQNLLCLWTLLIDQKC